MRWWHVVVLMWCRMRLRVLRMRLVAALLRWLLLIPTTCPQRAGEAVSLGALHTGMPNQGGCGPDP